MAWQLRSQKRKDATKDWEESREEEDEDKLEEDELEGGEQGEILGVQAEIATTMEERRDIITEIEPPYGDDYHDYVSNGSSGGFD